MTQYIKQRYDWDCGIAALAMALNVVYEAANRMLGMPLTGIHEEHLFQALIENGYAYQRKYENYSLPAMPQVHGRDNYKKRVPWPCEPFAPAHIVMLQATRDWHFVVMDKSGHVYDPWNEKRETLADPDYKKVSWVLGIWKVEPWVK